MGNKSSSPRNGGGWSQSSTAQSSSSAGWQHDYGQSSFSQYAQNYPVQNPYPAPAPAGYPPPDYAPPQDYGTPSQPHATTQYNEPPPPQMHAPHKKLDRSYSQIADNYNSLEQVCICLYFWKISELALLSISDCEYPILGLSLIHLPVLHTE